MVMPDARKEFTDVDVHHVRLSQMRFRVGDTRLSVAEHRALHASDTLVIDANEQVGEGVALVSEGTQFLYTKAGQAKVEMMADATKDARTRAEQIASQGSREVNELRSARMGVVQVNPLYSTATSWEGNNDTSSLEKTITVTVSAEFALK